MHAIKFKTSCYHYFSLLPPSLVYNNIPFWVIFHLCKYIKSLFINSLKIKYFLWESIFSNISFDTCLYYVMCFVFLCIYYFVRWKHSNSFLLIFWHFHLDLSSCFSWSIWLIRKMIFVYSTECISCYLTSLYFAIIMNMDHNNNYK